MPSKTHTRFNDAEAARRHLESLVWRNGPICPHCRITGKATILKGKSTRPGVHWCNACKKPFSVTVGTVYEGSKVPLNIWLRANHLLCSEKDMSVHRLAGVLGVSYKTAWFMSRHIREAMNGSNAR
jgi:transposase-like protein